MGRRRTGGSPGPPLPVDGWLFGLPKPRGGVAEKLDLGGRCRPIIEHDAVLQPADFPLVGYALYLHQINLRMLMFGMQEALGQRAVVGQQQQPFAVMIQPSDDKEPFGHFDQFFPGGVAGTQVDPGEIPGRLVQHHVTQTLRVKRFAVDAHIRSRRISLCAELGHNTTVNRHPTGDDQRLTCAPRSQASLSQDFLETLFSHLDPNPILSRALPDGQRHRAQGSSGKGQSQRTYG